MTKIDVWDDATRVVDLINVVYISCIYLVIHLFLDEELWYHWDVVVLAHRSSTPAFRSIPAYSDFPIRYFNIILYKVNIFALWPLALPRLKISAHWEGVQQL